MQIISEYNLRRPLAAIAFLIALTLACGVFDTGGAPTPAFQDPASTDDSRGPQEFETITPTVKETALAAISTPTPTPTTAGLTAGLVIGRANLVYTINIKDGDTLIGEGEAKIPIRIMSTGKDGHYIYKEDHPSTQVVNSAGLVEGSLCYITYTFTATYELEGDFYQDGCRFEFNIEVYEKPSVEETGNSCGYSLPGDHLFFPPEIGPHAITENNNPLTVIRDARVTHIYSIEDVELPTSIDCW